MSKQNNLKHIEEKVNIFFKHIDPSTVDLSHPLDIDIGGTNFIISVAPKLGFELTVEDQWGQDLSTDPGTSTTGVLVYFDKSDEVKSVRIDGDTLITEEENWEDQKKVQDQAQFDEVSETEPFDTKLPDAIVLPAEYWYGEKELDKIDIREFSKYYGSDTDSVDSTKKDITKSQNYNPKTGRLWPAAAKRKPDPRGPKPIPSNYFDLTIPTDSESESPIPETPTSTVPETPRSAYIRPRNLRK